VVVIFPCRFLAWWIVDSIHPFRILLAHRERILPTQAGQPNCLALGPIALADVEEHLFVLTFGLLLVKAFSFPGSQAQSCAKVYSRLHDQQSKVFLDKQQAAALLTAINPRASLLECTTCSSSLSDVYNQRFLRSFVQATAHLSSRKHITQFGHSTDNCVPTKMKPQFCENVSPTPAPSSRLERPDIFPKKEKTSSCSPTPPGPRNFYTITSKLTNTSPGWDDALDAMGCTPSSLFSPS
jgi:hypothetical protein